MKYLINLLRFYPVFQLINVFILLIIDHTDVPQVSNPG